MFKNYPRKYFAVIIIIIISIFYFSTIREGQEWGDFAQYILHAKNIATGKNYGDINCIFVPYITYMGPQTTSPGFPLLLAPIYKIAGLNFTAMKILIIGFFIASLILIAFLFSQLQTMNNKALQQARTKCDRTPSKLQNIITQNETTKQQSKHLYWGVIFFLGFNPFFWNFKECIVSDIPYLFFSILSIVLINRAIIGETDRLNTLPENFWTAFFIGFALFFSIITRVVGVSIFIAFIIYDIIRQKLTINSFKPSRLLLKSCGISTVFILVQKLIIKTHIDYAKEYEFSMKILWGNIFNLAKDFLELWHNGYFIIPTIIISVFLLAFAISGYIKRVKNITICEIYLPVYLIGLLLWPKSGGLRYLIPIIPFIFFYIFVGWQTVNCKMTMPQITHKLRNSINATTKNNFPQCTSSLKHFFRLSHVRTILYFMLFIFPILIFISYISNYTTLNWGHIDGATNKNSIQLYDFISKNTHVRDTFIFARPRSLALFTERKTALYPYTSDADSLFWHFKNLSADYLVVGEEHLTIMGKLKAFGSDQKFLKPLIEQFPDNFMLIYQNKDFKLYKIYL